LAKLEAINGEIVAHTRQVGAAVGGEQFVLTAWGPGVFGPGIHEIALRDAPIAAWRRIPLMGQISAGNFPLEI
jgi:hypothetical protein